jgi:hypothetical protein
MKVNIEAHDISQVYRLPRSKAYRGKHPPKIFVKFVRRSIKRQLYGNRIKRPVHLQYLGSYDQNGRIIFHEHLTKDQLSLYHSVRDAAKEHAYKHLWTQDQKIYIKKDDTCKAMAITQHSDITKFITPISNSKSPLVSRNLRSSKSS